MYLILESKKVCEAEFGGSNGNGRVFGGGWYKWVGSRTKQESRKAGKQGRSARGSAAGSGLFVWLRAFGGPSR